VVAGYGLRWSAPNSTISLGSAGVGVTAGAVAQVRAGAALDGENARHRADFLSAICCIMAPTRRKRRALVAMLLYSAQISAIKLASLVAP